MSNSIQKPFELLNVKLPYPLCVVEDRYGGVYSGAYFLAFNMFPFELDRLPIDAGDGDCLYFGENEANEYIIGKGETPEEAVWNLITLLKENTNER